MKRLLFLNVLLAFLISMTGISQVDERLYEKLKIKPTIKNHKVRVSKKEVNLIVEGKTIKDKAVKYLSEYWREKHKSSTFENNFRYHLTTSIFDSDIVRFRQTFKGLNVANCEISLEIKDKNEIKYISDNSVFIPMEVNTKANISKDEARKKAISYLSVLGYVDILKNELTIQIIDSKPILAYEIYVKVMQPIHSWRVIIDAVSKDIILADRMGVHFNAPSKVFQPNPTVSAKKKYGTGNFIDNNDINNADLDAQLIDVELLDITQGADDLYYLIGPNAQIFDGEDFPPGSGEGLFGQSSLDDFVFNRSDRAFEAVMCYYYIDKTMRHLNDELGLNVGPLSYSGGIKFDPHWEGWQNAIFTLPEEAVLFGDGVGDVDAGEDAFIIIHEMGHAIHHWLTGGNLSTRQGVSESFSDYWAQSSTKECLSIGVWKEWQDEYHQAFHWGLMPYAENSGLQRFTNYTDEEYTTTELGPIHKVSQHLSTALMRIFSDIGKDKTDKIVLKAMVDVKGGVLNSDDEDAIDLQEAGGLIYDAAVDIGCTENELCIIYNHLDDKVKISELPNAPTPPSGGTLDMYMKDGPCDIGEEINFTTHAMFHSPDIWVRHENDNKLEHQNPEFKISGSNWVYVRIRSRGCESYGDVKLHLYWSKASTGLDWPEDWTITQVEGPNGMRPAGGEITSPGGLSVPLVTGNGALGPGEEKIIRVPWTVPNPADYYTGDNHHFCLLARLVIDDDPMTYQELSSTGGNARKNNNITAKNVSIFDSIPGNIISEPVSVFVKCKNNLTNGGIKVESSVHPLGKSIYDYGNVFLEMEGNMESDWVSNGMVGSHFQLTQDGKIKALDNDFQLEGLNLGNCVYEALKVYFEPFAGVGECAFDVVQYDGDGVEGEDIIGRERFEYHPNELNAGDIDNSGTEKTFRKTSHIVLYPNPTTSTLSILLPEETDLNNVKFQLFNLQGYALQGKNARGELNERFNLVPLANIPSGIYFINITSSTGDLIESLKFVKQ